MRSFKGTGPSSSIDVARVFRAQRHDQLKIDGQSFAAPVRGVAHSADLSRFDGSEQRRNLAIRDDRIECDAHFAFAHLVSKPVCHHRDGFGDPHVADFPSRAERLELLDAHRRPHLRLKRQTAGARIDVSPDFHTATRASPSS